MTRKKRKGSNKQHVYAKRIHPKKEQRGREKTKRPAYAYMHPLGIMHLLQRYEQRETTRASHYVSSRVHTANKHLIQAPTRTPS